MSVLSLTHKTNDEMKKQILFFIILCMCLVLAAQESYEMGPNSWSYDKIPAGTITHHSWESKIYPNTSRDYVVYVPAQYDAYHDAQSRDQKP